MYIAPWFFMNGDDRKAGGALLQRQLLRELDKRNWSVSYGPEIDFKAMGRFSSAISGNWSHNVSDNQFYGKFTDATNLFALHHRAPRSADDVADGSPQLHFHAKPVAADIRTAVRLEGDLQQRSPGLVDDRALISTTIATRRTSIRR